jgi:hypothetical protein
MGFRRAWNIWRRQGETINKKRAQRLRKAEKFQTRPRSKRRRKGRSVERVFPAAEASRAVRSPDFAFDALEGGMKFKTLPVGEGFTRERLA